MAGRPITRRGHLRVLPVGQWTGTVANGQAFTVGGTCVPNGTRLQYALVPGSNIYDPGVAPWADVPAAGIDTLGNWSVGLTGASGSYVFWVRRTDAPRVMAYMPFTVA